MAAVLPNPFALKSSKNHRCLKILHSPKIKQEGVLQFHQEDCDPNFRTENAQIAGYVHIRFEFNGKYLKKGSQDGDKLMIVAAADNPNEDTDDEDCTLFMPQNAGPSPDPTEVICRIMHVQSGLYLRPHDYKGEKDILFAVKSAPDSNGVDVCTAVGKK